MLRIIVLMLSLLGLALQPSVAETKRKLMIIGIDGTRPDALRKVLDEEPRSGGGGWVAASNWLDHLERRYGSSSRADWNTLTGDISFSGPGWASMLTGVWCDKHRVLSNEFIAPNFEEYKPIFALMKEKQGDLKTASIAHWDAINEKILTEEMTDYWSDKDSDQAVEDDVVALLMDGAHAAHEADAIFVHFDDVDYAGHACCYAADNENYLKAIRATAIRLQKIRNALKARLDEGADEEWMLIYSTDHGGGGVIGSEHGTNTDEDRRTFFIVQTYRAPLAFIETPQFTALSGGERIKVVDIGVTALNWLDIEIDPAWDLDGQVVADSREEQNYMDLQVNYATRPIPECGFPRAVWDTGHGRTAPALKDKALPIH